MVANSNIIWDKRLTPAERNEVYRLAAHKTRVHLYKFTLEKPPPNVCKECGGSAICVHDRIRSTCKECGGSAICAHDRRRSLCKECGGGSICAHDRQRYRCKECGGSAICVHDKRRSECKECGGSAICVHDRIRSLCKECGGSAICAHDRRRSLCKECGATVDEEHWLKAWQLRCETQLTLAQAAAAAAAESVAKGPHYVDSWQRLGQHIASLGATHHGTQKVRAARDEPRAYIEALEHSQERHARLLLEAAVTSNGMSTYAARERTVLMGHVDLAALRRSTDAHGVPLESALCLLLDRDVSELKEYARRPLLLGESACAVLHPAGIMTFAVHLAHTPRAFHSPLYRRDLAKALMMADQQVRITMPTAEGPVLIELKVYDAAEAAAARPKVVTRLEQWQVLGTRVARVAELGSRPTVAVIEDVRCDFWFLQADVLRGALGPLPPNLHRQRSMYEKLPISLSAARVGAYVPDVLVRVALDAPAESEREVDDAPAPASKRAQQAGPDWVQYASWVVERNQGEFSNLEL
ncbi:hypothetical protein Ctob_011964 [Chrysochromulina tobinii]|uniref:Uncharacterized protein n=1 Tax=Chrysochromulina tobinii TaxID=1460289 RepID=A0A0M0K341_9EUKA|nr:hypothetical protein Ctob_011964 [Chrysochromulina tobinii]|eukprot:KOO32808.1 hypothetical protein Ctob_011964 [Chrysochromulina sp. CCMP291]